MKLSLNIKSGTLAGKAFELNRGTLTIGRGEMCIVRFDPLTERIASKQHAYIEEKPDGFYIFDNNSTNGTFLNGRKIQSAKLASGDTIHFGSNGVEASVFIAPDSNVSEPTVFRSNLAATALYPSAPTPQINPVFSNQPVNFRNSFSGLGAVGLNEKPQENKSGKYIGAAVAIFAVVFLSLIVVQIVVSNLGLGAAIIASAMAFLPAMFYLIPLVWRDRYDPEPVWLLALAFAWGALVAIIFSYFVNTEIAKVAAMMFGSEAGRTVGAVISAPIFEEASKGLGVVLLLIFFRRYFDDILDGIVFAGTIALGFATVENVLYYGGVLLMGNLRVVLLLYILRGILSPFAHVTFTSMTGIGCGIARESHNTFVRIFLPFLGYACAVALHLIWNLMATVLDIKDLFEGSWYYGYLFIQVPFFALFVGFAAYVMYRQNRILKEMLAIDVARNLIPEAHLKKATSAFGSTFWLLEGVFSGKFNARNKYLRAVGKLGLSYWHIQRATAAHGQTGSFQQNPILREEVLKWRDKV
ncbi:MAG TPA: PrsW family glutamic-type intramembrane protease [Pyrinomonadaceae bacterium]